MFLRCMRLQSVVAGEQQQKGILRQVKRQTRNATLKKRIFGGAAGS